MDLQGKLASPEFSGCSLPLTAIIDGKKIVIGQAMIDAGGYVIAKVNDEEVEERLRRNMLGRFTVKLNPEVRLEPRSVTYQSQHVEPTI